MPEFIDTSPADSCLFCRLIRGEIPSAKVYEDELTFAFMDIAQVNPGHVLIATKRHAATFFDITADEAAAVIHAAQHIALAVKKAFSPTGVNLLQNNGSDAWQSVDHFHLHILPRHPNDGVGLIWPRKDPDAQIVAAYAQQIADAL